MTASTGRTALYRLYDASDRLLYIGISHDPDARFGQHQVYSPKWAPQAARRTLEWLPTRQSAAKAETAAIRAEGPLHNKRDNFDLAPFPCPHWPSLANQGRSKSDHLAALIRQEIAKARWLPGQKVPPREAMARSVGVDVGCAVRATERLLADRVLLRRRGAGYFIR